MRFDRDQLVLVIDCVLNAVIDRVDAMMPHTTGDADFKERRAQVGEAVNGMIETAGMSIASIYAQVTNDGIGIQDALAVIDFEKFVYDYLEKADTGWRPEVIPGQPWMPDTKPLAEKFVDELFADYLGVTNATN